VVLVINLNNAPWISTTADLSTVWSINKFVRANDSKWYFACNLFGFCNSLFIFIIVDRRLEDVDIVGSNVGKNLGTLDEKHVMKVERVCLPAL
jgi:hypothetical protein